MLFAGLQRKTESRMVVFVLAESDDPSWHIAFELITRRHIAGSRTAEAHRQTKTLRRAAHDVRIQRFEQCERHEVSHHGHFESRCMTVLDKRIIFLYRTVAVRPLDEGTEEVRRRNKIRITAGDDVYVLALGAGTEYRQGVRPNLLVHKHLPDIGFDLLTRPEISHHGHRLGSSRRFVKQRTVGKRQAREVTDHRLKDEQRFQSALAHLSLVRGIRGVPDRVFEHVTTDDGRRDGTVPTAADQRTRQYIVAIQFRLRHRQVLLLRDRFIQLDSFRQQNILRHRLTDELVQRLGADGLQHVFFIGGGESYMAGLKKMYIFHL